MTEKAVAQEMRSFLDLHHSRISVVVFGSSALSMHFLSTTGLPAGAGPLCIISEHGASACGLQGALKRV